ncbi:hypothetical protein D3C78_952760 [compost metagenome]
MTDYLAQQPAAGHAETAAADNHPGKGHQAMAQALAGGAGDDEAVHHHRQQRADRIDDDAFPAQDVGDGRLGPHHPQHRYDHRRPGDQGQGAEQGRQHPVKTQQPMGGQGNQQPGRQRTEGDHALYHAADVFPLRQVQGQAALEQDQRHRQ